MYGDQPWSPRQDDQPYADDVKVAGAPTAEGAAVVAPSVTYVEHDTTARVPVHDTTVHPEGAAACEETRDDLPRVPRARRSTGRRIKVVGVAVAVALAGGGAASAWALTGGPAGGQDPADGHQVQARGPVLTAAQRQAYEAMRLRELKDRARTAARAEAPKPTLLRKGSPKPTSTPGTSSSGTTSSGPVPAGSAQQIAKAMLADFGFGSDQFGCLVDLWNRESGWRTTASNPSGAYGIPQALPGSKMSSAGADWQTSASTQIKWGLGYIKDTYGSPCAAWSHWQANGSY